MEVKLDTIECRLFYILVEQVDSRGKQEIIRCLASLNHNLPLLCPFFVLSLGTRIDIFVAYLERIILEVSKDVHLCVKIDRGLLASNPRQFFSFIELLLEFVNHILRSFQLLKLIDVFLNLFVYL